MQNIVNDVRAALFENEEGDFQCPQKNEAVCDIEPEYKQEFVKISAAYEKFELAFATLDESIETLVEKWLPRKAQQTKRVESMHARMRAVLKLLVEKERHESTKRPVEQGPITVASAAAAASDVAAKRARPDSE